MSRRVSTVLAVAVALFMVFAVGEVALAFPEGEIMSDEEEAAIEIDADVTIHVDHLAEKAVVDMYDVFTVGIEAPEDHGVEENVRVLLLAKDAAHDDITLEYLEQEEGVTGYGEFHELTDWFWEDQTEGLAGHWYGPTEGFPLVDNTDAPSVFRIHWEEAGTFNFAIEIWTVDEDGNRLDLVERKDGIAVTVEDEMAMDLSLNETTYEADVGEEFDIAVTADLTDHADHLDHALFLFTLERDGITADDFEVVNVVGYDYLPSYEEHDGLVRGYWGPSTGFLFDESTTTEFQVRFDRAGTYTLRMWAIQVDAVDEYPMDNRMPQYYVDYLE